MKVIKKFLLEEFLIKHPDAEQSLKTWLSVVRSAEWTCDADILKSFPKAQLQQAGRSVVFEVVKGRYYLIAFVEYSAKTLSIQRIGGSISSDSPKKVFH